MVKNHYEVAIIGGGISGTALFYEIARYTDIKKILLLEKYSRVAELNSRGSSNSQTIHCGDIETNYTLEKARKVRKTANMVNKYCLQYGYNEKFMFKSQKMAFGVGDEEVEFLSKRYEEFKELYPYLEVYDKEKLKQIEPNIIFNANGTPRSENVIAMGAKDQYSTISYGEMALSFIENTLNIPDKQTDIEFNSKVILITPLGDKHYIKTADGASYTADFVVVDAGAHSLFLAHKMGHGLDYGNLSVAGSFYLSNKKILNGKVYMVQDPKLPFAALHGDPDILADMNTRFGPTALALPKLERYHGLSSVPEFFKTMRFDSVVVKIFKDLLSDSTTRNYILRNFLFEIPYYGKKKFLLDARKLVPSLQFEDIYYAKGFGGVRPQVMDKKNQKLMLGEASINPGTGIIFNMTPSPGATSCLGNAWRDVGIVCEYLGKKQNTDQFNAELCDECEPEIKEEKSE